jgi:hypothetical protein
VTTRSLANQAHGWFRTWFAKIWKVRGGGLYACGYAVTFAYLEVKMVVTDFVQSDSVVDFVVGEAMQMVMHFAFDSIANMVKAAIWPLFFVQWRPPYGAIGLALAFFVFTTFLKAPITRWLFPDGEATPAPPDGKA